MERPPSPIGYYATSQLLHNRLGHTGLNGTSSRPSLNHGHCLVQQNSLGYHSIKRNIDNLDKNPHSDSGAEMDTPTLPIGGYVSSQLLLNRLGGGPGGGGVLGGPGSGGTSRPSLGPGHCWVQQNSMGQHTIKRNIETSDKNGERFLGGHLLNNTAVSHVRFSWKCSAIGLMLLLGALVIALVYLMASSGPSFPNGSQSAIDGSELPSVVPGGPGTPPGVSPGGVPRPGSRDETGRFMDIYFGRRNSFKVPAYGHWNIQIHRQEAGLVKFNFTSAVGSSFGIYGSKNRVPSHTRYDFVEVIGSTGGLPAAASPGWTSPVSSSSSSSSSSSASSASAVASSLPPSEEKAALLPPRKNQIVEFVRFLDRGLWYVSVYNDGPEPQEISLVPTVADESNIGCPYNCRGHGTCVMGTCKCDSDFAGESCEFKVCSVLCSDHGRYLAGECVCDPGYKGKECQLRHDECEKPDCTGNGDCVNGHCHCYAGYGGQACESRACPDPSCGGGNGACVEDGHCLCKAGWAGTNCTEIDSRISKFFPDCTARGVYDLDAQQCICGPGWRGDDCSIAKCKLDCGRNGVCEDTSCSCHEGWEGVRCERKSCDPRCLEHGQCTNGTCTCQPGWLGRHCTLNECPGGCSGQGECGKVTGSDGSETWRCQCFSGWTGKDCSVPLELECNDRKDNDNDGLIDCADSECCSSKDCLNNPLCFSSAEPLDILLRKQPPSPTASFFQRMQFLIEEDSVQSYAHRQAFNDSMFWTRFNPRPTNGPHFKFFHRASVIRGQVVSPSGSGLMGVRVGIANDPLLGFVVSREGGWFDIMVNGGSAIVLHFQREPFRPTHRTVTIPWNEIVVVDTVKMNADDRRTPDYKSPICIEHDYELTRPTVEANWNNAHCSARTDGSGLLADGHVLHESLTIPGTDLSLVYNSSRASGYRSVIELTMTPEKISNQLKLIHLKISVEGNLFERQFEADPLLKYTYAWNRRNVYRQKVYGVANAIVSVGYEYSTCPQIIWSVQSVQLAGHDMSISEIGGWNLNIHHRYNFHEGILQKGDGSNVYLKNKPRMMVNLMGDGEQRALHCPYCTGQALEQRLLAPMALASGPDGSIYVGDFNLIRRIAPDGQVTTVVEMSAAQVAYKYHIAVGPVDGKLYISDPERHQVLRAVNAIDPANPATNLEVIAGTGMKCLPGDKHHCGDGRNALEAKLTYPKGIAVSVTNEMFIADGTNIRLVDANGMIHTLIGDHHHKSYWKPFPCSGTIPLQKVNLRWPTELAINPLDNSLHILDDHMVLKLTQDKRIRIVAGRPGHCSSLLTGLLEPPSAPQRDDDTFVASDIFLETPTSIAFSSSGKLFIAESDSQMINRVRVVSASGRISRYAGLDSNKCSCMDTSCECYNADSTLASSSKMSTLSSITVSPDGNVIICDQGNLRLRSVISNLPPPSKATGEYEIISHESLQVYIFNKHGQHMSTKSVLTGKFVYNFTYIVNTSFGKLSSVTDARGNRVQLLRDYSNQVKEIETSQGTKCRLEMSSRTRLLEGFILPSSSKTLFQYYTTTGLIKSKTFGSPPFTTTYEYDKNGRLVRATGSDSDDVRCL
ncbi:Teneurin-m [Halotydeus destructor]|nr:Teneurin-m [Halotydeus destructor]